MQQDYTKSRFDNFLITCVFIPFLCINRLYSLKGPPTIVFPLKISSISFKDLQSNIIFYIFPIGFP